MNVQLLTLGHFNLDKVYNVFLKINCLLHCKEKTFNIYIVNRLREI